LHHFACLHSAVVGIQGLTGHHHPNNKNGTKLLLSMNDNAQIEGYLVVYVSKVIIVLWFNYQKREKS
jgi:hypothetical protein